MRAEFFIPFKTRRGLPSEKRKNCGRYQPWERFWNISFFFCVSSSPLCSLQLLIAWRVRESWQNKYVYHREQPQRIVESEL